MNASDRFLELVAKLGGISQQALDNFFYWRNPFALENWTLNVVELLMLAAAALALVHAVAMRRRTGDASYIGVWMAAALYCIFMEVPIYFTPGLLGLDDGAVIFIHNEFTAGAFFGRMPFYILALYPALLYPSYVLVRQRGLFDGRWGLLRGAVSVGVVHHCFYEIFDHLGPQLKWWLWDYDLPTIGDVTLASVPLYSQVNFSLVNPIAFALLAHALLGSRFREKTDSARHRASVVTMTLLTGLLTTVLAPLLSLNLLYSNLAEHPNRTTLYVLSYGILAIAVVVAVWTFWRNRATALQIDGGAGIPALYIPIFIAAYLMTFFVLWTVSLPDYLAATGELTAEGTPIGSLSYALMCAIACLWLGLPYLRAYRAGDLPGLSNVAVAKVR